MRRKPNIFMMAPDKMLRLKDSMTSIKGTIKLKNFITVFLILSILLDILELEHCILSTILHILSKLTILTINPYVYIYTQAEIKIKRRELLIVAAINEIKLFELIIEYHHYSFFQVKFSLSSELKKKDWLQIYKESYMHYSLSRWIRL